jgi:hypothetical protein
VSLLSRWGGSYLVCSKKTVELIVLCQRTNRIVIKIYSIVGVRQPNHIPYCTTVAQDVDQKRRNYLLVARDGLALLEAELVYNRLVVRITFFHVRMSGCQVGGDETETRVMIL